MYDVAATSGVKYHQVEIIVSWEKEKNGSVRVDARFDDGGRRAILSG
jgi:hypothetical protein